MQITKVKGRYNFCSNEEQWRVAITGLPNEAPAKYLSKTWDIEDEPYIKNLPPSEVVEIISERVESFWISTSREKDREIIQWIRNNSEELDVKWAKGEIKRKEKAIGRLQEDIERLEDIVNYK